MNVGVRVARRRVGRKVGFVESMWEDMVEVEEDAAEETSNFESSRFGLGGLERRAGRDLSRVGSKIF